MFDWNDEELTNIIWGDEGETDDHIVPYRGGGDQLNRKEWVQESKTVKTAEEKTTGAKIDLHGRKLESSSNYNVSEGIPGSDFGLGLWPESSLSKAAKTDQDSISTEVSNNLAEPSKYSSISGAKTSELGKDPDIFHSAHESKEQGDFVDYSWANIGSFDDLDRIFSNDVPIFGEASLGSADELWSSSKDVTNSPQKAFPTTMDSPSLWLDIKTDHEQQDYQKVSLSRKANDPSSRNLQHVYTSSKPDEHPGCKNQFAVGEQRGFDTYGKTTGFKSSSAAKNFSTAKNIVDKAHRQKKLLKFPKRSEENCEVRALHDLYGNWTPSRNPPGQLDYQLAPSVSHSSSMCLSPQKKLQVPQTSQYEHISNPYVATSSYGNLVNPYSAMPVSTVPSVDVKNQILHASCEASPGTSISVNKSADAPGRHLTMTPQEKIEKLRRRQQMRAMLAIQRQQQQLRQVPGADCSITPKCPQDNQLQLMDGANVEDVAVLPSFDPSSPLELDDSNTVAARVDDCSAEYSILYRLQDVVAKLDMSVRLCIRDSLFRLAQSALQRHHATDSTSTKKTSQDEKEVLPKEEASKSNRYAEMPDTETETNPIDRIIAHLLFHRPLELSAKHPDMPESPAFTKLEGERKVNFLKASTPEGSKIKQNLPQKQSIGACPLSEAQKIDQFETNPCIDNSAENASNCGPAGADDAEVEASQ